uniref:Uncharacterized protein n=1 Tax=Acanthochromis polyacanthus TaxID=80966 RepID=A0A3Q1GRL4_9TELE
MRLALIFLVMSLVVLMAEPGECLFGRLKAWWRGGRQAWKEREIHSSNSENMPIQTLNCLQLFCPTRNANDQGGDDSQPSQLYKR